MNTRVEDARAETNLRLRESRSELRHLLHDEPEGEDAGQGARSFPRSKTLQLLTSSKVLSALAIAAVGVVVLRPRIATKLIRLVPFSAIARMAAIRFFAQRVQKHER